MNTAEVYTNKIIAEAEKETKCPKCKGKVTVANNNKLILKETFHLPSGDETKEDIIALGLIFKCSSCSGYDSFFIKYMVLDESKIEKESLEKLKRATMELWGEKILAKHYPRGSNIEDLKEAPFWAAIKPA